MIKASRLVVVCLILLIPSVITAQENRPAPAASQEADLGNLLEALKDQALVLRVQVRQLDQGGRVVWRSDLSRITVHGRVVGFKLEGTNVHIDFQLTPYRQDNNVLLVVQSQIWIKGPTEQRVQYHTHFSSVLGDVVLYYPLGRRSGEINQAGNEVEVEIAVVPYTAADRQEN